MKENIKIAHMKSAFNYAELSYCVRKKVGSIIVKNDRVISIGYNGTKPGDLNVCEDENNNTLPNVIHAEKNAIKKIEDDLPLLKDSSIFVTMCPCLPCAELILKSGITEVYYAEEYRLNDGVEFLKINGIFVQKISV